MREHENILGEQWIGKCKLQMKSCLFIPSLRIFPPPPQCCACLRCLTMQLAFGCFRRGLLYSSQGRRCWAETMNTSCGMDCCLTGSLVNNNHTNKVLFWENFNHDTSPAPLPSSPVAFDFVILQWAVLFSAFKVLMSSWRGASSSCEDLHWSLWRTRTSSGVVKGYRPFARQSQGTPIPSPPWIVNTLNVWPLQPHQWNISAIRI